MEHSAGKDYSLEDLLEACVTIARNSTTNKIIVQKSTGPIGLAESIEEIFQGQAKQGVQLEVLSNPEFLSQGSAVQNLLWPSRVIIGSSTSREGKTAAAKLRLVYRGWVKPDRIYFTDRRTAELTKLASNTLLAQKISSINALSSICESERCNIDDIAKLCGADSRIGPLPTPSLGFGGSCLRKDVLGLSQRASRKKLPAVASYFDSIVNVNEFQTQHCVSRVVRSLVHLSTTPSVAVLGFSFKKETTDVSETSVVPLTKALQEANIAVRIYDPQVSVDEIRRSLGSSCAVEISSDAYEACKDAHAIVIATDWPQFVTKLPDAWRIWTANSLPRDLSSDYASKYLKNRPPGFDPLAHRSAGAPSAETRLDWRRIASLMKSPRCVFDFCDVADRRYLRHLGFVVETIGLSNEQMEREPHVKEVAFIPSS
ncbi:MAG: UDP-glucose 6-dehydrogenase 1 [Stictis urceolatum]|nr:UDP-glucose 6-dehydrogenase 1 [Stictis urceolata]